MSHSFARTVRGGALHGRRTWKTWIGLVTVALIVVGTFTWAFFNPFGDHGGARAAVVNLDEPVTVAGQVVPLGRRLAGDLVSNTESAYRWTLTDRADADAGLADGRYATVVTIPANFSARATSSAGKDPAAARQATIAVTPSPRSGLIDPVASSEVARATLAALNQPVVRTYLDNVYVGFNSLHDQIGQAATGAEKLATGTSQLAGGTGQLAGGSRELATGLGTLATGADQVADGAGALADGADQLRTGADQLSTGLTTASEQAAALPAATGKLATGARQVADGNAQLADTVVPLTKQIVSAIDDMPSTSSVTQQVEQLAASCDPSGSQAILCADLKKAAAQLTSVSGDIDKARDTVRSTAETAGSSIQKLADGADQVATGNEQLAAQSPALATGIASAATGAQQLAVGVDKLATGARDLAPGARQVADGVTTAGGGARQVADGAARSADGAKQLDSGARDLSTGLGEGAAKIPSYTAADRDALGRTAVTPAVADLTDSPEFGAVLATLVLVMALWLCALSTYLVIAPVPADVLTSREPTWRAIVRAAVPGAAVATVAATVLSVVLAFVLGMGVGTFVLFLLVALLTAYAFTAVNQAAAAIFGRYGRYAVVAVLALTVTGSVISTVPVFFTAIMPYLPTHGALVALRALALGGDGGLVGVVELVAWLAVGIVAAVLVVDRRRALSGRMLRGAARPVAV